MPEAKQKKYKGDKPHIRAKVLSAILAGSSYVEACGLAGISPDTMSNARRDDPDFGAQVTEAIAARGEMHIARRHALTPEGKEQLVDIMRTKKIRMTAAAEAIGVSASTLHKERLRDPDFDAAVAAANVSFDDLVEDALLSTALKGNVKAMELWLYNRSPQRWAPQRILERRVIEEAAREAAKLAIEPAKVDELSREEKLRVVSELAIGWAERTPDEAVPLRLVQ